MTLSGFNQPAQRCRRVVFPADNASTHTRAYPHAGTALDEAQIEVDATTDAFDLKAELINDDDEFHGKCNAVFVGFTPTADQYALLQLYSQRFQVRVRERSCRDKVNGENKMEGREVKFLVGLVSLSIF